jgi:hypothetical protein
MEPEGSLLCSQEPATGPRPEPYESIPHPHIISLRFTSILSLRLTVKIKFHAYVKERIKS